MQGRIRPPNSSNISDKRRPLRMARGAPAITLPVTRQQSPAKFIAFASSVASPRHATTSSAIVIRGRAIGKGFGAKTLRAGLELVPSPGPKQQALPLPRSRQQRRRPTTILLYAFNRPLFGCEAQSPLGYSSVFAPSANIEAPSTSLRRYSNPPKNASEERRKRINGKRQPAEID